MPRAPYHSALLQTACSHAAAPRRRRREWPRVLAARQGRAAPSHTCASLARSASPRLAEAFRDHGNAHRRRIRVDLTNRRAPPREPAAPRARWHAGPRLKPRIAGRRRGPPRPPCARRARAAAAACMRGAAPSCLPPHLPGPQLPLATAGNKHAPVCLRMPDAPRQSPNQEPPPSSGRPAILATPAPGRRAESRAARRQRLARRACQARAAARARARPLRPLTLAGRHCTPKPRPGRPLPCRFMRMPSAARRAAGRTAHRHARRAQAWHPRMRPNAPPALTAPGALFRGSFRAWLRTPARGTPSIQHLARSRLRRTSPLPIRHARESRPSRRPRAAGRRAVRRGLSSSPPARHPPPSRGKAPQTSTLTTRARGHTRAPPASGLSARRQPRPGFRFPPRPYSSELGLHCHTHARVSRAGLLLSLPSRSPRLPVAVVAARARARVRRWAFPIPSLERPPAHD